MVEMQNQNRDYIGYEELLSSYSHILFDTSALHNPFSSQSIERRVRKIYYSQFIPIICKHMTEYINNDAPFFVTQGVFEESGLSAFKGLKDLLVKNKQKELYQEIEAEKSKLLEALKSHQRIIVFEGNEKELYGELLERCRCARGRLDLSNTDFDFLISGLTLASSGKLVALVSNDLGIGHAWKRVLSRSTYLDMEKFGFFKRTNTARFEKFLL